MAIGAITALFVQGRRRMGASWAVKERKRRRDSGAYQSAPVALIALSSALAGRAALARVARDISVIW